MTHPPRPPSTPLPDGLRTLVAMAAAEPRFAEALATDREPAIAASGVSLTPAEAAVLLAMPASALRSLVAGVGDALPEPARRGFLRRAGQALVGLGVLAALDGPADAEAAEEREQADRWLAGGEMVGGGGPAVGTGSRPDTSVTGSRPDQPRPADDDAQVELVKVGCTPPGAQLVVQRVLHAHLRGGFRYCYRRALVDQPKAQGKLELTFQVATDGKVVEAKVTQDEVKSTVLSACTRARLLGLRFPAREERTVAVLTLRFFRRAR